MDSQRLIAVVGPTASGKTRRAVALARAIDGEIVSGDSRQVYRRMSIGTGKDIDEYGTTPYHLIDIVEPGTKYNLYRYLSDARNAIDSIRERGRRPIVCGGTGLYVESLLAGLSLPEVPENKALRASLEGKSLEELTEMLSRMKRLHNDTDVDTTKRAIRAIEICQYYNDHPEEATHTTPHPIDSLIVGVDIDRESRRRRITQRLHARMAEGMAEEVKALLDEGIPAEDLLYYGLEYKFVTLYVTGQMSKQEMLEKLEIAIHQFAKRQMTWFRGMETRGYHINWIPFDVSDDEFVERVLYLL